MSREVLGSGVPEFFRVSYTGFDGRPYTYHCDTIKKAQEVRAYFESIPRTDMGIENPTSPKGPVRIARFRGEWL